MTSKLTLAVILATALPTLLGGLTYLWIQRTVMRTLIDQSRVARIEVQRRELQYMRENRSTVIDRTGEILADAIAPAMKGADRDAIENLIGGIDLNAQGIGVRIVDTKCAVAAERIEVETPDNAAIRRYPVKLENELLGYVEILDDESATDRMTSATRSLMEARNRNELRDLEQRQAHLAILFAAILAGMMTVTVVIGVAAIRHLVLARVKEFGRVADRMGRSDYSARCPEQGRDELDLLARSFNQMADQIAESHLLLERRIEERTRKLEETHRALAEALETARAATEARGRSLASMSHEVRTPMNGVLGMTELLLETELQDHQRGFAETIRNSALLILSVINDVLDFAKIEAGKIELDEVDLDLEQVIGEVADLLAIQAGQAGVELLCEIHPSLPAPIRGDVVRLRQVIQNLASNAVKFTQRGEVLLRALPTTDGEGRRAFTIAVEDTGIGIAPDKLDVIFEPFSQADVSTTRKYGGTGLGLVICKHLVELMGGVLRVESEEGHGTRFWFTLPLHPCANARLVQPLASLVGKRVLLAVGNQRARELLVSLLASWGFAIEEAANGEQALDLHLDSGHREKPFDLIMIDQNLPEVLGSEVLEAIASREVGLRTPAILTFDLASRPIESFPESSLAQLAKPVRPARLRAAVLSVLGADESSGANGALEKGARDIAESEDQALNILLVEDNPVNQKVATTILERAGHRVEPACDGYEAITRVRRENFDIILMDCRMPGMDGFEATRAIRAIGGGLAHIPIIAMTANTMEGDRESCLRAGMNDYLSKPIRKHILLQMLATWTAPLERNPNAP